MTGVRSLRLRPVVAAVAAADRARLAACLATIEALRAKARDLRCASRQTAIPAEASDMSMTSDWQLEAERSARESEIAANNLLPEAARLRGKLSLSIGREIALDHLIANEKREAAIIAERRAEDQPPVRKPQRTGR